MNADVDLDIIAHLGYNNYLFLSLRTVVYFPLYRNVGLFETSILVLEGKLFSRHY